MDSMSTSTSSKGVTMSTIKFLLNKMNTNISDADVQKECCTFLTTLAINYRSQIVSAGAIGSIITAMSKHIEDIHVQMSGCRVFEHLAQRYDDDKVDEISIMRYQLQITNAGGMEAIQSAMSKHHDKEEIQEIGIIALWTLSHSNMRELVKGIDVVRTAMVTYKDNSNIQRVGRHLLIRFCPNDIPIQHILLRMKNNVSSEQIQRDCCDELLNLAGTPRSSSEILYVGGMKVIVTTMSHYPHHIEILVRCLKIIVIMADCDDELIIGTVMEVAKSDIIEAIITAMHNNIGSEQIQEWGFRSLWSYAHESHATLLTNLDLTEITSSFDMFMRRHPQNKNIQDLGQHILIRFAPFSINIENILLNMKENRSNAKMQIRYCAQLGTLSTTIQSTDIAQKGGIEVIVTTMSDHPDTMEIQKFGCIILSNLASTELNLEENVSASLVRVVINAMSKYVDSEIIQRSGFGVLFALSAETIETLGYGEEATHTFKMCLSNHLDDPKIQMLGCQMLMRLEKEEGIL